MGGTVLTPGMAAIILFSVFFLLLILRVPVAFALGLACHRSWSSSLGCRS
jgi:hypothetical protein